MSRDQYLYIGPYVRVENKVISTEILKSDPHLGCSKHKDLKFTHNEKYCPKCGTQLSIIETEVKNTITVSDKLDEIFSDDYDDYINIQGHVEKYNPKKLLFIIEDSNADELDCDYGESVILDFNEEFINNISEMKNSNSVKYAKFYKLIKTLDELETTYTIGFGLISYWMY